MEKNSSLHFDKYSSLRQGLLPDKTQDELAGSWHFQIKGHKFHYEIIKSDGRLVFHDETNHEQLTFDQGWYTAKVAAVNSRDERSTRILRLKLSSGRIVSNLSHDAEGTRWEEEIVASRFEREVLGVFEQEPLKGLPKRDILGLHSVDPQIVKLMDEAHAADRQLPMTVAAAEAVGKAQKGVVVMLLFYVFFLPVTMMVQQCPGEAVRISEGIAEEKIRTPMWFTILVYVIFVGFYLVIEMQCLGYILPIQLQALGDFRYLASTLVLKIDSPSYHFFKIVYTGLSFLGHVGIISNGLFVARILKAHSCEVSHGIDSMIEEIWQHTLSESSVMKFFPVQFFSLRNLVLLAWCLKALQFLHAFCWAFPVDAKVRQSAHVQGIKKMCEALKALFSFIFVKCCGFTQTIKVDYKLPDTFGNAMSFVYEYRTLLNETQNHGAALQVLADVLKFWTVRSLDFRFAVSRMRRTAQADTTNLELIWRYLHHAQNQMAHAISGFLFTGIFENMLFLHLQISLSAINQELPFNGKKDSDFLFSSSFVLVVMNLMLSLLKFVDAISVINVYTEVRRSVLVWGTLIKSGTEEANTALSVWKSMSWRFFRYLLYVLSYMYLLGLAFAKVFAIFGCNCKLWNLTGGCATLEGTGAICEENIDG